MTFRTVFCFDVTFYIYFTPPQMLSFVTVTGRTPAASSRVGATTRDFPGGERRDHQISEATGRLSGGKAV